MGSDDVFKKTALQLQRMIRVVASDTSRVAISDHARQRMRTRRITDMETFDCLRAGVIHRTPEPNLYKGSVECRMAACVAGRDLVIVVAVSNDYPDLIVVTALEGER